MGPPAALESIDKLSMTTAFIWTVFSGQDIPAPILATPSYVDVRDVARAVVFGIQKPEIANNERYLLTQGFVFPQTAADILRKHFPESHDRIKVGHPGEGLEHAAAVEKGATIDGSKLVKASGQGYYSLDETVVDTAKALEKFL